MEMERTRTITPFTRKVEAPPVLIAPARRFKERPDPRTPLDFELEYPGLYDASKSLANKVAEHRAHQRKFNTQLRPRTLRDHAFEIALGMFVNGFTYSETSAAWHKSRAANVYIFGRRKKVVFWEEFTVISDYPQSLKEARKRAVAEAHDVLQLVLDDCWAHMEWLYSRPYARPHC